MDLRERPFQKKYPTKRGKKSQPAAKGTNVTFLKQHTRCWPAKLLLGKVGLRRKPLPKSLGWCQEFWFLATPPSASPNLTDRPWEGGEGGCESREGGSQPGRPTRGGGARATGDAPGTRGAQRRPGTQTPSPATPCPQPRLLKWVRLPSDFYGLNSAIKSNHSRIKQNKFSSTRHSCRKVFSKNTR